MSLIVREDLVLARVKIAKDNVGDRVSVVKTVTHVDRSRDGMFGACGGALLNNGEQELVPGDVLAENAIGGSRKNPRHAGWRVGWIDEEGDLNWTDSPFTSLPRFCDRLEQELARSADRLAIARRLVRLEFGQSADGYLRFPGRIQEFVFAAFHRSPGLEAACVAFNGLGLRWDLVWRERDAILAADPQAEHTVRTAIERVLAVSDPVALRRRQIDTQIGDLEAQIAALRTERATLG
jgi:hypothetical protein